MAKKNNKIYLILAGGTCLLNNQGNILFVQSQDDIEDWLSVMPELNIMADIEPIFVSGEDDVVDLNIWNKIVDVILKKSDQADGFVVVSKIDQLINTSLAISFSLQNLRKTIVLTSSQISGTSFIDKKSIINELKSKYGGLSLRSNLINAIQIASHELPNPAIIFGTRLISATKAISLYNSDNPFSSIDNDYWGKVDFGINIKSGLKYNTQKTKIYKNKFADILILEDIPGVDWNLDKNTISSYAGLFIKTNPYQKLEESKNKLIAKWKMPVVLYNYNLNQHVKGAVNMLHCTENVAIIKMMWGLSQDLKNKNFENLMTQNVIGEFLD